MELGVQRQRCANYRVDRVSRSVGGCVEAQASKDGSGAQFAEPGAARSATPGL